MFNHDLSDATVVYFDNTCSTPEQTQSIYNSIPKDCLFIYKSTIGKLSKLENTIRAEQLVYRTYNRSNIIWLVKNDNVNYQYSF